MSGLFSSASLKEFFKSLLEEAIAHQNLKIADVTEFYLVNLLSEFATSEKLFQDDGDGKRSLVPLAVLYHQAQQQEREERIRTLRQLGDVSLYRAGFFASSLKDGPVGREYYRQMGSSAYGQVATLASASSFASVYRELGEKFRALSELLGEISARGLVSNGPVGTLKVYEAWSRSGDDRLERVLVDVGMIAPPKKGPSN
jgi:hypothetical protein